jgi:hypothetical protein
LLSLLQVIFFANEAAVAAFFQLIAQSPKGTKAIFSPESGAASRCPQVT